MNKKELAEHLLDAIDNPPNQKEDIAATFRMSINQNLIDKIRANADGVSEWEYKELYRKWR